MTDSHQRVDDTHRSRRRAPAPSTPSWSPTASTWSACSAPATSTSASSSGPSTPTSTSAATRSRSPASPARSPSPSGCSTSWSTIIRTGQGVTAETVERVLAMLRAETTERPADVLTLNILQQPRPDDPAQDAEPEALRRRDRQAHDHLRHRPGRHRQDLPRDGQGRAGAAGQAGQPDHPDPPGGRGGRAARLPARHAEREDRPLPAPALRRAARHDRPGVDPQAAGRRHHRGRAAGLHARPDPQRRVHHPRRGAEHLARADEDVPDPARASAPRSWSPATSPRSTCPAARKSGLRVVEGILDGIEDIVFHRLTAHDVVRHRLVGKIVAAYDEFDAARGADASAADHRDAPRARRR